jgi:hypothetical protein
VFHDVGINLWKGTVNPAAPFDNEFGTLLTFGVRIDGNGSAFKLSQVSYTNSGTDPGLVNADFTRTGEQIRATGRALGYRNGVLQDLTTGDPDLDLLIFPGFGFGVPVGADEFGDDPKTQTTFDRILRDFTGNQVDGESTPLTFTGTYSLAPAAAVPEPATAVLGLTAAVGGLVAGRFRRRAG